MKTVLLGAHGQLGTDIRATWPADDLVPLTSDDLDVTDRDAVLAAIAGHRPDLVLNTTAFHNVDVCEDEPARAFAVNAIGPKHLADACAEHGAALMHLSTDYVFSGRAGRPYTETDAAGPDQRLRRQQGRGRADHPPAPRPRTTSCAAPACSASRAPRGKGGNFVETHAPARARRQADQGRRRPDALADVHRATSPRSCSRSRRAAATARTTSPEAASVRGTTSRCAIFEEAGLQPDVSPTTSATFAAKARRPEYSVLANDALARRRHRSDAPLARRAAGLPGRARGMSRPRRPSLGLRYG